MEELGAAATFRFERVERGVSEFEEFVGAFRIVGEQRTADACAAAQCPAVETQWRAKRRRQLVSDEEQVTCGLDVFDDQREFVAANPSDEVTRAKIAFEALG